MNQVKGRQNNSKPNPSQKPNNSRYSNWPGAVRDVLVTSLNKGQFPVAVVLLILLVIFWRLPETDLSGFLKDFLNRLENNYIIGWIFFVLALFGWFFHNRFVRKTHYTELDRVTKEKEILQEKLFKKIK